MRKCRRARDYRAYEASSSNAAILAADGSKAPSGRARDQHPDAGRCREPRGRRAGNIAITL